MVKTISREELQTKLNSEDSSVILIDALPETAYRKNHIPGAINIPSDYIKEVAPKQIPNKNAEIVVYYGNANCKRSQRAAERLEELGYNNVWDYHEGRQDWEAGNLPISTLNN